MIRPHGVKQAIFKASLVISVAGGAWGAIGATRTNYEVLKGESAEQVLVAQGHNVPDELHANVEDAEHDRGLYITLVEVSLGAIAYLGINRNPNTASTSSVSSTRPAHTTS